MEEFNEQLKYVEGYDKYLDIIRIVKTCIYKKFNIQGTDMRYDDYVQMCIAHCYKNLENYNESKGMFSTFIYENTTNCMIDYFKSNMRKKRQGNKDKLSIVDESLEHVDDNIFINVKSIVEDDEYELIELHYKYGYTLKEIGNMKSVSKQAIHKKLIGILNKIRATLN